VRERKVKKLFENYPATLGRRITVINNVWGQYSDPDTEHGLNEYSSDGLLLLTPNEIQDMNTPDLRSVAGECAALLDSVYKGNYPHNTKDVAILATSMREGETLMFALMAKGKIIAMASLVRRRNGMRGDLKFIELSKAAKLPTAAAATVSARHLSKYRLAWAMRNLPEVDFLYGSPRAASQGKDGAPGGKQAQSVWWGGRRHNVNLPLITTNVGWNFRVGGIEPLTGFVVPTNATKWANAVGQLSVFVPDEASKNIVCTLFGEGTDGFVTPRVIVVPVTSGDVAFTFREARPPSADIVTKYYVTGLAGHLIERSIGEVDEHLGNTISQKVIIESDIAATPEGAQIMRNLLTQGWALAGWQPSEVVYGAVCPMLARVNPSRLFDLIQPTHYPQYFDEGGLSRTRQVLDGMYQAMYANASNQINLPASS
jgi:hypothetical protein